MPDAGVEPAPTGQNKSLLQYTLTTVLPMNFNLAPRRFKKGLAPRAPRRLGQPWILPPPPPSPLTRSHLLPVDPSPRPAMRALRWRNGPRWPVDVAPAPRQTDRDTELERPRCARTRGRAHWACGIAPARGRAHKYERTLRHSFPEKSRATGARRSRRPHANARRSAAGWGSGTPQQAVQAHAPSTG